MSCGEHLDDADANETTYPHVGGLIREQGTLDRPIRREFGNMIAYSLYVSGDVDGVREVIKSILDRNGVIYKENAWKERDDEDGGKSITFSHIPTNKLANLGNAIREIGQLANIPNRQL